ncbi:MAG: hypothetical protein ACM3ML_29795 [Micromonosporaceae bacterium]
MLAIGTVLAGVAWGGLPNAPPALAQPDSISFSSQPSNTVAGEPIVPPVTVLVQATAPEETVTSPQETLATRGEGTPVQDAGDAAIPVSGAKVIVYLRGGPGATLRATLGGTTEATTDDSGIAAFTDLTIDTPGDGYFLVAQTPGLNRVESKLFNVVEPSTPPNPPPGPQPPAPPSPGPAPPGPPQPGPPAGATLTFVRQPTGVTTGAIILPPVVVRLTGLAAGRAVTLTLRGNTGAALHGNVSTVGADGVATFSHLSISGAGSGYRLIASTAGAVSAMSAPFDVHAAKAPGDSGLWRPIALAALAAAGAGVLLGGCAAAIHRARRGRAALHGQRAHATPHPDAGTVDLGYSDSGTAPAHTVRLEPHPGRGAPHLGEES